MKEKLSDYGLGAGSKDLLLALYSSMLRIRIFEEKIVALYPEQEMKCPVHLCLGQEAISAGVCLGLEKKDRVFSNHRGHGHYLAKGGSAKAFMAELYGKATGCSRGKGGSMHLIDREAGVEGTSAIVGGGIPMAVGAALASKMTGDGRVTVLFFGDGAFEEGVLHESFNFACLKRLPIVFVCENNGYATNSPRTARQAGGNISDFARSFGAPGTTVDGNDAIAVYDAAQRAISRARSGEGPSLIEALTYRWKGHVGPEFDHEKGLRPKEELTPWLEKCPVEAMRAFIVNNGIACADELEPIAERFEKEAGEAVKYAKASPFPEDREAISDVYYNGAAR